MITCLIPCFLQLTVFLGKFKLNLRSNISSSSADLSNEEKITNIRSFCLNLTKNSDYFTYAFNDFFSIPETFRSSMTLNLRKTDLNETLTINMREYFQDDSNSIGTSPMKLSPTSGNFWIEFHKDDTSKYCPYFSIKLADICKNGDHYLFTFEFQSRIHEELSFKCDKRYSDFKRFLDDLKSVSRARPPSLPQRLIIKEKDQIEKRGRGLKEWISIVVNEKMFHSKSLFTFIGLPEKWIHDYLTICPLRVLYHDYDITVDIPSYDMVNKNDRDDIFILFNIKVTFTSKNLKDILTTYQFKRRFREFDNLHGIVKRKFKNYNQPLPELPTKVSLLGKVDSETRQYKLRNYLKLLVCYPDIFDVIAFRKFMMIEPEMFKEFKIDASMVKSSGSGGSEV